MLGHGDPDKPPNKREKGWITNHPARGTGAKPKIIDSFRKNPTPGPFLSSSKNGEFKGGSRGTGREKRVFKQFQGVFFFSIDFI